MPRKRKLAAIKKYVDTSGVPDAALMKMAKLGAVVDHWMAATEVAISAVQCWTSIEENLRRGALHRHEHDERQSAVERLRSGYLRRARHACAATGVRNALARCSTGTTTTVDDPNKAVCFHCSNLPKHFFRSVKMDFQEIIAGTVGKENTFGTCVGRDQAGAR